MGRKRLSRSPGPEHDDPPGLEQLPQLGADARRSSTSGRRRYRIAAAARGAAQPRATDYINDSLRYL